MKKTEKWGLSFLTAFKNADAVCMRMYNESFYEQKWKNIFFPFETRNIILSSKISYHKSIIIFYISHQEKREKPFPFWSSRNCCHHPLCLIMCWLYTWLVSAGAQVRNRISVSSDAVHLPGLHAASTQTSLVGATSVLLAEQHVHATLRPLRRPPGVADEVTWQTGY